MVIGWKNKRNIGIEYELYNNFFDFNDTIGRTKSCDTNRNCYGSVGFTGLCHMHIGKFTSHRLLEWGKNKKVIGKFFRFCIEKGKSAGRKLQDTAGRGLFIALVLFIGIPIPGTGAWTGILAASILRMDFKKSIMACLCGIMLAGVIMAISSMGVLNLLDIN